MTGSEHYQRALILLSEVEQAEKELGDAELPYDLLNAWNADAMRKLKIAEIHMTAALVRK